MSKFLVGTIITVVAGMIVAATAWNFSAVASMPERYETLEHHHDDIKDINRKLDRIIEHLIGGHSE